MKGHWGLWEKRVLGASSRKVSAARYKFFDKTQLEHTSRTSASILAKIP